MLSVYSDSNTSEICVHVLVLAGMGLVFFLVAGVVLRFRFGMRGMLIMYCWFGGC